MRPASDADSQQSVPLRLMFLVGFAMIFISVAGVIWSMFSPPRQYYPVEKYSAVFADEPDGPRLLPHDDPNAHAPDSKIEAEVTVVRAIPMKRARRGWREYSPTHHQPTQDVIDKAGPAFGLYVRLKGVSAMPDGPRYYSWPPERGPAMHMPIEKVRQVLPLLAADIRKQSGKAEYADAVEQGSVDPPPLSIWAARENRFFVYIPGVIGFILVALARLIAKGPRRPAPGEHWTS